MKIILSKIELFISNMIVRYFGITKLAIKFRIKAILHKLEYKFPEFKLKFEYQHKKVAELINK